MNHFSAINALVMVVESGGFTGAARQMGVATSSISRQVDALEAYLGAQLLNRSTRSVTLTDIGQDYYQQAKRILNDLNEINESVSEVDGLPRGLLRISLPVAFGRLHVAAVVPEFLHACPEIELDMILTDNIVNLVEDRIDIAIRIGALESSNLIARKLAPHRRVICASSTYLSKYGEPETPSDLTKHNCLTFAYASGKQSWKFMSPDKKEEVHVKGSLRANNSEVLLEAALGGVGIILLPGWLLGEDIKAGNLHTILNDWEVTIGDQDEAISAVYLSNRRGSKKVRAFTDFLVNKFGSPPYWDK